jgi:hypothetical protein
MSNLLPDNCTYILNIHQLNILAALKHRIKIAKLQQNVRLIELLEIEKKNIYPLSIRFDSSHPYTSQIGSISGWFKLLKNSFIDFVKDKIVPKTELQVKKLCDEAGNEWWYAYDPKSGKSVYVNSDAEMRLWIESQYQDS